MNELAIRNDTNAASNTNGNKNAGSITPESNNGPCWDSRSASNTNIAAVSNSTSG